MFGYANEHENLKEHSKAQKSDVSHHIPHISVCYVVCVLYCMYVCMLMWMWKRKLCLNEKSFVSINVWKTLDNAYCLQKWYILWGCQQNVDTYTTQQTLFWIFGMKNHIYNNNNNIRNHIKVKMTWIQMSGRKLLFRNTRTMYGICQKYCMSINSEHV
jgi:hypothetical protein